MSELISVDKIEPLQWVDERYRRLKRPPIIYVAHPVAKYGEITVEQNLQTAMQWWKWLHVGLRSVVWIMPWYVNVTANGEGNPDLVQLGLRDDCVVVAQCDAILLCGERVSSGMAKEARAALAAGLPVFRVAGVEGRPPRYEDPLASLWECLEDSV